ncbi:23 kDa integral membrane protein [Taenia solium]|eukprot:TsM_000928700 transcript=TsM_000928700 gene=TsM_000928700
MGVLQGGMKCVKYCTFFFNFIVFVFGLFLAGSGGYLLYQLSLYSNQVGDVVKVFSIALIVLGFIILIVGFLGCCGACYESPCMLITFAVIVAILLCLQIAVAVFAFMYKDELMDFLSKRFEEVFSSSDTTFRRQIERELHCCGFKMPDVSCGFNVFEKSCWSVITSKVESSMYIIIATAGVLCLIQIAAIIAACCLQSKIRSYAVY